MQKYVSKILIILMVVFSTVSAVLRFFQLKDFTDSETGLLISNKNNFNLYIYIFIIFAVVSAVAFCRMNYAGEGKIIIPNARKEVNFATLFVSFALFFDFVHQCYNCYTYIETSATMNYTVFVPMIFVGAFAIASGFYYFTVFLTTVGKSYDYTLLKLFHFVPLIWILTRLLTLLVLMLDVDLGTETIIEFAFLFSLAKTLYYFVYNIDSNTDIEIKRFNTYSLITAAIAIPHTLPRIIMMISGNYLELYNAGFSAFTDAAVAVFFVVLTKDIYLRHHDRIVGTTD